MPRLFAAITLPETLAFELELLQGGIHGARWESADKLHVTLQFFGDVDHGRMRTLVDALARIERPAFALSLQGSGFFPPGGTPQSLWVGVERTSELTRLHDDVSRAARRTGIDVDARKFRPHVTVARLARSVAHEEVMAFLVGHALFRAGPFEVDRFVLMSSVLSQPGSKYRIEAAFRLGETGGVDRDP